MLLEYVKKGGKLLVIGPAAAKLFEKELGVTLKGEAEKKVNGLAYSNWIAAVNSEYIEVDLGKKARPFGEIHYDNDFKKTRQWPLR